MKSVKIQTLTLTHFMGAKNFTLEANGDNLAIFGSNGTGKTTLFSAFTWLLFDKDSQNQKNFDIKTKVGGQAMKMTDHEVEAVLQIDERRVTLRKVYKEVWTKKRGSATAEFTGHETLMYIDEVPTKKGEYTKFIESIVEEDIFKLLSSPSFFNEQLPWKERRNILLRIAGEVSNDEIFKSNDKLKGLAAILDGKKIEDFRKMQAEKKKKINDELQMLPVRIDEIQKSMPSGTINAAELEKEVAAIDGTIESHQNQIQSIRSGNAILNKQGELQQTDNAMRDLQREIEFAGKEEVYKLRTKVQEEQSNLSILERRREKMADEKREKVEKANALKVQMDELRPKVLARIKESYEAPEACGCPTCGQDLPAEQIEAANAKAEAAFNLRKSEEVARMKAEGAQMKERVDALTADDVILNESIGQITDDIEKKEKSLAKLTEQLTQAESGVKDVSENADYQLLSEKAKELKEAIAGLQEGADEAIAGIQDEIASEKVKRQVLQADLAKHAGTAELTKRIVELEGREEVLAAEYETIEHHVYLTDEFIRAKVRIMEERINSKFKYVTFKLFEVLLNGGVNEICETLVDGVSYDKGLNNAARINAGLDIIRTLSEFHGLQCVQFLDNAESVVEPLKTDAQMIRLIVSGEDKKLRVERV